MKLNLPAYTFVVNSFHRRPSQTALNLRQGEHTQDRLLQHRYRLQTPNRIMQCVDSVTMPKCQTSNFALPVVLTVQHKSVHLPSMEAGSSEISVTTQDRVVACNMQWMCTTSRNIHSSVSGPDTCAYIILNQQTSLTHAKQDRNHMQRIPILGGRTNLTLFMVPVMSESSKDNDFRVGGSVLSWVITS